MLVVNSMISVSIVSMLSIVFAVPFLLKKKISKKVLIFLLSVSVGVLLATVFINFLPEVYEHEYSIILSFYILAGFLVMFILEKFIHFHHTKKCENGDCGHSHGYNLAPINLIGDGIHNFIDGLVIAGSFAVSSALGVSATISIILHEIPQEIADFGVLLYSGMNKKKALIFNFVSSLTAILGALIGILLIGKIDGFDNFIVPFAAGNFLYIAASNLVPELHRHCKLKETFMHILAIIIGIGVIAIVKLYFPGHSH